MENQTPQANQTNPSPAAPELTNFKAYPGMPQPPAGLTERLQSQKTGGSKKLLIIGIIAVIVLVLAGVGGWWYYAQGQAMLMSRQMSWPWGTTEKNFKVTGEYQASLKFNLAGNSQVSSGSELGTLLPLGVNNLKDTSYTISSNFNVYEKGSEGDFKVDFKSDYFNTLASLNYIAIGPDYYLQLTSLDDKSIAGLQGILGDPNNLMNKWLSLRGAIPESNMGQQQSDLAQQYSKKYTDFINKLRRSNLISITDTHEIKKISAAQAKKIKYRIIPGKGQDFFNLLSQTYASTELDQAYFSKIKEDPKALGEIVMSLEGMEINMWLGTKDNIIYGLELINNNFQVMSAADNIVISFEISLMIESIPDKQLAAPADAMTLEQFMTSLMPTELTTTTNSMLDSDNDGLTDQLEAYYGTDPRNPDTDGDGYLDGQEMQTGHNPLGAGLLVPLNDIKPNFSTICENGGGKWFAAIPKSTEQCLLYASDSVCANDAGCYWNRFVQPNICAPARSYCDCPNALKIYESDPSLVKSGFVCPGQY